MFQKDYEAVYIKIDTMMSEITKKLTELEQTQTDRSRFKNNKNRENKGFKINYVTKNSRKWLGWDSH